MLINFDLNFDTNIMYKVLSIALNLILLSFASIILFSSITVKAQTTKADFFFEDYFWDVPNSADYQKVYNAFQSSSAYSPWRTETLNTDFKGSFINIEFSKKEGWTIYQPKGYLPCNLGFYVDFMDDKSVKKRFSLCTTNKSEILSVVSSIGKVVDEVYSITKGGYFPSTDYYFYIGSRVVCAITTSFSSGTYGVKNHHSVSIVYHEPTYPSIYLKGKYGEKSNLKNRDGQLKRIK